MRYRPFLLMIPMVLLSSSVAAQDSGSGLRPGIHPLVSHPIAGESGPRHQAQLTAEREEQRKMEEQKKEEMRDQSKGSAAVDPRSLAGLGKQRVEQMLVPDLLADQKAFCTSSFHLHASDAPWIAAFLASSSLLIGSDTSIEQRLPAGSTFIHRSRDFSNAGTASLIATAGTFYFWGRFAHNRHARETGWLGSEALADSFLDSSLIKLASGRDRPLSGDGKGEFWRGGRSFPSEHAAAAWSLATVIAHEYPGPLTKLLAYGAASAVSASRVTGREHFAADAFLGSALGWYTGRQVYRAHHDVELGGASSEGRDRGVEASRNPGNMGSPYVSLDSWVYPALQRLAALGYTQTAFLGLRPWTRMECARVVAEVGAQIESDAAAPGGAAQLYAALAGEFAEETRRLEGGPNSTVSLDSMYTRTTAVSGVPLRDGYHVGQTLVNDYGRPYGTGFNAIAGLTAHWVAGPLSIALQGEYQHAPAVASDPSVVLQATAAVDGTPPLPDGTLQRDRFQLLNSAAALTFHNIQISFGKQNLWLGPGEAGPLLFSSNAEPLTMLRIDSVSPYAVPFISRLLGPVRSQFFIGRLSGQSWEFSAARFGPNLASQPFIHGTKIGFHPTANLELGFGFTAQFGGSGNPFTWDNFLRTFYSHRAGFSRNPGKRLSEFNFNYRVPGLRNELEVYLDSMVIDEYSPLGSNRPAINPGIYLPQLPKLPRMDLRLEGVTTDLNVPQGFGPGAFYWDDRYRSGYTNNGDLIGSWIGRRGRGEQAWLTYHFSPRADVQFEYRHTSVDKAFLQGGQLQDFLVRADVMMGADLSFSGFVQRENWKFPVLSPIPESDLTASLQLTFWPKRVKK